MKAPFVGPMMYCCNRCGKPRGSMTPCPDCGDVEFSLRPGPLHAGWRRRQQEGVEYVKRRYLSWRERAAPIIARVLESTAGQPEDEVRRALFDAYPFGPRQHFPYKTWLSEIKRQRRLVTQKADTRPAPLLDGLE